MASLLSKRFHILSGLAGSGKTKLAQAFCYVAL
jgi:MoxR-like ATPase